MDLTFEELLQKFEDAVRTDEFESSNEMSYAIEEDKIQNRALVEKLRNELITNFCNKK